MTRAVGREYRFVWGAEVHMLGSNGATAMAVRRIAPITVLLLVSVCGGASPAPAAPGSGEVAAVWVPKEVKFVYVGFTTKYSCDGLQDRVQRLLSQLGARDLKVVGYNCMGVNTPETTTGLRIVMQVLQPASATAGQTVAAQWKTVDLLADRDPFDAARDCELISEFHRDVLPLFTARHVDYSATCPVNTPLTGGTRLKMDVLAVDKAPPVANAR